MRYVKLKGTTWHYARNYPQDVRALLGRYKLQQTLRTSDAKIAATRGAEVNNRYEDTVRRAREGLQQVARGFDWEQTNLAAVLDLDPLDFREKILKPLPVGALAKEYLRHKGKEMARRGYEPLRYSINLFVSRHGQKDIRKVTREEARTFQQDVAKLSATLGKSNRWHGASLDALLREGQRCNDPISVNTRKRIWTKVQGFFDWAIHEGHLKENPFRTLRFEGKGHTNSYAVPTDAEVSHFLSLDAGLYGVMLRLCLLSGLRSGEALGLMRDDLIHKGNLGTFLRVRSNDVRGLKTAAAERLVPLHVDVQEALRLTRHCDDRLFPDLSRNMVTKWFRRTCGDLGLDREGLVFHSTRKWFITQCERQGVPEHFTASLVRPQGRQVRQRHHLRYLFGRDIGRTEAWHYRPDPVAHVMIPDIEAFEERAAICQYDAGYSRERAEQLAAKAQGFEDAGRYWKWLADYVVHREVPTS